MTERVRARHEVFIDGQTFIGADGKEYPDPTPMAPPVGYKPQPDLLETIRSMVQAEHRMLRDLELQESEEEALDLDVDEDGEADSLLATSEEPFDPVDAEARRRLRQALYERSIEERQNELTPKPKEPDNGAAGTVQAGSGNSESGSGEPNSGSQVDPAAKPSA